MIGVGVWGLTGVPALVGAAQAALAVPDGAGAGSVAGLREEPQGLHVLEVWGQRDMKGDRGTSEGIGGQERELWSCPGYPKFQPELVWLKRLLASGVWAVGFEGVTVGFGVVTHGFGLAMVESGVVTAGFGVAMGVFRVATAAFGVATAGFRVVTHVAEELIGQAQVVVQGQEGDALQPHHDDLRGHPEATVGPWPPRGTSW